MISAVKRFLADFTAWASQRQTILAVALVGSHSRGTATPSSDVDLVIVVRDPNEYLSDTTWIDAFGHAVHHAVEPYGNFTSLRVWYQQGLEVEFGFSNETWPLDSAGQEVIADGIKVLLDRGPLNLNGIVRN